MTSTIDQPLASESPKGRPRVTDPRMQLHGAEMSPIDQASLLRVTVRRGVRWKREALLLLLRDRLTFCAARRRSNARSSRHARAPACAAAPRPAKAASTAAEAQTTGLEACVCLRGAKRECIRANSLRRVRSSSARVSNETCAAQAQRQQQTAAHACERARCGACGLAGSFKEWSASAGCC